jgi:hypothetical protein
LTSVLAKPLPLFGCICLGWNFRTGVGLFFDGHERSYVVDYRKLFVERWASREAFCAYLDEATGTWQKPSHGQEIVFVTLDECITRANDAERKMWLAKDQIA